MTHAFLYRFLFIPAGLLATFGVGSSGFAQEKPANWKKHIIMEPDHCNTAVAIDANGDPALDVIASFNRRVSLFLVESSPSTLSTTIRKATTCVPRTWTAMATPTF